MNEITTSDIYFAAALLSYGAKLGEEPDRDQPRHIKFKFIHEELDLDDFHTRWINGEVSGKLSVYAENIRKMKQVLHSG